MQTRRTLSPLLTALTTLGLFALTVWMLYHGRVVLVPLAFALVVALVLTATVDWLGELPGTRMLPSSMRHAGVLVAFVVAMVLLGLQVQGNAELLLVRLPQYQANILQMLQGLDERFDLDQQWDGGLSQLVSEQLNLQAFVRTALGTLGNLGGLVTLILLYTAFLMVEYSGFVRKLHVAFPEGDRAGRMIAAARDINHRIGGFLAIKTALNVLLGGLSYLALLAMGVELAGFWAIVIGVLNYVPYLGSFAGVVAPSLMALAQSGSLQLTIVAVVVLSAIQFVIGALIEPRLIGRRINLSPLIVLVSLASWYALWGFAGAALAIPMTVILLTVLGAIPASRPLAVLLSNDGRL